MRHFRRGQLPGSSVACELVPPRTQFDFAHGNLITLEGFMMTGQLARQQPELNCTAQTDSAETSSKLICIPLPAAAHAEAGCPEAERRALTLEPHYGESRGIFRRNRSGSAAEQPC